MLHAIAGVRGIRLPRPLFRAASCPVRFALLPILALAAALAGCGVDLGNAPGGPGITVPVQVVSGEDGATLILLPVTIDGKGPFTFALDTGASTSLVDTTIAQRVGLPQVGTPQPISGVGGNTPAVPVKIQSWQTNQLRLPAVTASAASLGVVRHQSRLQGLVGSDVWRQFGSVDINYSNQTVTVPNQIASAPGTSAGAPAVSARLPASRLEFAAVAWRDEAVG